MSLATYDLFTDEEATAYYKVITFMNAIDAIKKDKKQLDPEEAEAVKNLLKQKKESQEELSALIKKHAGKPRVVRLKSVLDHKKINKDETSEAPQGITWWTLKPSKRIAEFASEASRAMGLTHNQVTFDKIIVKWKSIDILEQIVLNGFIMPILTDDGTVINKKYRFLTASAGQLRTDKLQFISEDVWPVIKKRQECGMDWDSLNAKGGMNVNKQMAYTALACSATDDWQDVTIDQCIVIKDFEAPVTGIMKYIKPDYSSTIGEQTVTINHCDGIGMMQPSVSTSNFMVRLPYIKGLLTSFDYIRFCQVNNVPPVIADRWGTQHDLIKEDIRIIFTESQFKLAKFYDNWDHYKRCFKECGCHMNRTNFEEDYIPDTTINYQMQQTLEDFSDDEINAFTQKTFDKIVNIGKDPETMQRVLHAEQDTDDPYCQALSIYPPQLRDAYSRETLRAIKKRWLYDAKSGRIKCKNKRLFAIPDMYAACEYWFLNDPKPKGLLANGEIACKIYQKYDEADVLRSPHLYMEHAIRSINHDPAIYEWFYTNGVYTSCHDLISRILQFDVDGDQLNVVVDPIIVSVAKRNIEKYNVIPLFYDANKAAAEKVSRESLFNGLKRAHDFSGIGIVSNSQTKQWNRDTPDREAAAWLCYYNNLVIDAAKTGVINSYENYPDVNKRINKATGGKRGKMPHFFRYSKNGRKQTGSNQRKKTYAKANQSVMNRICERFDTVGNINMNLAGVPPFNWQMLMPEAAPGAIRFDVVNKFCELDSSATVDLIETNNSSDRNKEINMTYTILKEHIVHEMLNMCGSLEEAYVHVAKYLFTGENMNKASHKQMFWRVFGDLAQAYLISNIADCYICPKCHECIPAWSNVHFCPKDAKGMFACLDCGAIVHRSGPKQCRCNNCQEQYRKTYYREWKRTSRKQT